MKLLVTVLAAILCAVPAVAAVPLSSPAQRAAERFPQAVRVGDLHGRDLLTPSEAQNVLGYVAGLYKAADGSLLLLVDRGGILGFGATPVLVPLAEVALLGEHVTLIGLRRSSFAALPRADLSGLSAVPPDASVQVAITGPFH